MNWKPGTQIVQYEMWVEGVGTARPVTVVEDGADHLALYSHPGARIVTCGLENRGALELSDRIDLYMGALKPRELEFREAVSSDNHVLTITPPDAWHSVWLFWSAAWELKFWYVNFQSPLRRVNDGVELHDFVLDIVVRPDMSWAWKDMDEFEALAARDFFSDDQQSRIRDEADELVATIESRGSPFSDGWESWRPDCSWQTPWLPDAVRSRLMASS